jgi:hypothetical protein
MTIDEAIKRNKDLVHTPNDVNDARDRQAIQVGIEALERLKELRIKTPTPIYLIEKPLPSETED